MSQDSLKLDKHAYHVLDCDLEDLRRLVEKYHYARGGSNTSVYAHGLFDRHGRLLGGAWWLPPTGPAAKSVNPENWKKVLALTRLVLVPWVPPNGCSFLIGRSIRLIRRDGRFVSLVTYADESQNHRGTIYRATNWEYKGMTQPKPRWLDPATGRQVACKATVNRTNSEMLALGYVRDGDYRKHKFVYHLR